MNKVENNAYNEGLDAQNNGASLNDNPYAQGTSVFSSWELGWQNGAEEDYEDDMNRD